MPIYQYRCPVCGREVELLEIRPRLLPFMVKVVNPVQSMVNPKDLGRLKNDRPICNVCDVKMKRVPALSNFQLKGSGWAKDGYGGK